MSVAIKNAPSIAPPAKISNKGDLPNSQLHNARERRKLPGICHVIILLKNRKAAPASNARDAGFPY